MDEFFKIFNKLKKGMNVYKKVKSLKNDVEKAGKNSNTGKNIFVVIVILLIVVLGLFVFFNKRKAKKQDLQAKNIQSKYVDKNTKNLRRERHIKNKDAVYSIVKTYKNDKNFDIKGRVKRVVDGDTLQVENNDGVFKVRLLGVDTPESVHPDPRRNVPMGKVAKDFTNSIALNKEVRLSFDIVPIDKYNRLLAVVTIIEKNEKGELKETNLNELLLKKGLAKVMTIAPNVSNRDKYKEIEKKAREEKIGIWK